MNHERESNSDKTTVGTVVQAKDLRTTNKGFRKRGSKSQLEKSSVHPALIVNKIKRAPSAFEYRCSVPATDWHVLDYSVTVLVCILVCTGR